VARKIFWTKMHKGLCLKRGCKNKRVFGSAVCESHRLLYRHAAELDAAFNGAVGKRG